jgi:DNA polymerase I-like protein with 3'-5' exonuclease and polymerase domains
MINERFVPLFAGIEKWKLSVEDELAKNGRIGTLSGNFRYREKNGELKPKERRWAISQVVQGTGSLILKKLINLLTANLTEVAILLPMHDALLVEVPENRATEVTAALLDCCRKAFSDVCPLVAPFVCEKPFAE